MVHNIMNGGAASSVLAKAIDVPLEVIDVGVNNLGAVEGKPGCVYLRANTAADGIVGDLSKASAMSAETFVASVQAGVDAVDRASDVSVLILGELGIGNTTAAASVCAYLLDRAPDGLVGRGTGVDDNGLARKVEVVQSAIHAATATTPAQAIQQIGGRDIAAMFGAIGRAAERGIAVLVDGYVVAAAALALIRTYPVAAEYVLWSHCSQEQGHKAVLESVDAVALLDLEFRLGEATGALTAFPILELACEIHRKMATFDDAAVPNREG